MGWESVPWAVGGGAQVSAEIARVLAYAAFNGNDGILAETDLKVTAFGTPGAGVNVGLGAAAFINRAAGQSYQAYAGRMTSQDTVSIAATSGSARNDLIMARIEDPWLTGEPWADPPVGSEGVGPYIFSRVASGVTASVIASYDAARAYILSQGWTAIPLAGLTIPASTSAITSGMVTDLRRIANPRSQRSIYTINPGSTITLSSATMADWFGSFSVAIPVWATRAVVTVNIGGMRHTRSSSTVNGTANGQVRAILGTVATQAVSYDFETSSSNITARYGVVVGDTISIASALRGTTQTLKIQGSKLSGNIAASVDTGSAAVLDVQFQEVAG